MINNIIWIFKKNILSRHEKYIKTKSLTIYYLNKYLSKQKTETKIGSLIILYYSVNNI